MLRNPDRPRQIEAIEQRSGEPPPALARNDEDGAHADGRGNGQTARELRATISELRTAREELRRRNDELIGSRRSLDAERARFRELFDFAPDAYLVTDGRGIIRDANVAARELFSREERMLIGKPLRLFVQAHVKWPFHRLLQQIRQAGRISDVEITIEPRAADVHHVLVSARTFPQTGAPIEEIRWQFRDITERVLRELQIRQMNAELEERVRERTAELARANAAKDEFLGLISHELKTPIAIIGGNADVLIRHMERLNAEQRVSALADVREAAERLHRIIDNLLVLARLERGQELAREPLRLDLLVARLVVELQQQFPNRRVISDIEPRLVVSAAEIALEQVVQNLISNAQKYSPASEPIDVSLRAEGSRAVVRVGDRGVGVPEEEIGRLFTPFFRARSTQSVEGTGIGLAVCKRLVEAQDGEISAALRPRGGMEFRFSFPLVDEDAEASA